ncbi:MAG: MFS transporter [Blastomonas fulva]|uniref:MFS transporter n=1 Tax=Blastomonas fulva TaxID=1550728 RepID=UPI0024E1FBEF|nr:MFS transporter [Blastomonas fulva]MDK2756055.1 MFS transporter [Blastomonas fulva]
MTDKAESALQTIVGTPISSIGRSLTLGLLLLVAVLSYVDRQIFTLFQDDIKAELGLSDGELGLLTGLSFALFYALAAFPVARYSDRGDRRLVVAVSVIVWSAATAFCGLAANFWQMMLARIGLAAGESGAGPASYSLLVDIFPPERRVTVISSMLAANSVGLAGGLALAGWLSLYFTWREVFLIVGLPGIGIGLLTWLLVIEPRREGTATIKPPEQHSVRDVIRTMAANISLRWVALALMTVPVTGFALIIWGASFFQRVHGMDKSETGFWLGGAMLGGLVVGNMLAGWLGDRYGTANPRFNGWLAGAGLLLSFPIALLFALGPNPYVALVCFMAVKFLMTLFLGPLIALSYAQVPVSMRAITQAVINMLIGLAGTGIGGTLAGVLSQAFGPTYGDMSLRPALACMAVFLLVGGVAAFMAGHTAKPLPEQVA